MRALLQLLGIICTHRRTSWPQTNADGTFVRCLDCGSRAKHTLLLKSTPTMGHAEHA